MLPRVLALIALLLPLSVYAEETTCDPDDWPGTVEEAKATHYVGFHAVSPVTFRGVAAPKDVDIIHVYTDRGGVAPGGTLMWDSAKGELELILRDANAKPIDLEKKGDIKDIQPGQVKLEQANSGGNYYIEVRSKSGDCIPYTLIVNTQVFLK